MTQPIDAGLFLLGGSIICAAEVWRRLDVMCHAKALATVGRRASRGLSRNGASDFSKERLAGLSAYHSMRHSFLLAASLFAVASPVLTVLALDNVFEFGVWNHLMDVQSRLTIAVMTFGLIGLRYVRR